jgi:hypothetical protein
MNPFEIPHRLEAVYRRAIALLIAREIPVDLTEENVDDWLSRVAAISDDLEFLEESRRIAIALVKDIMITNSLNWRQFIRSFSGGSRFVPSLYIPGENVRKTLESEIGLSLILIKELPRRMSQRLSEIVDKSRSLGSSEYQVVNQIKKSYTSLLVQRVKLLSQTDPHRINSRLTEARSQDFELPCFIWSTAKDEVVRVSHQKMDGVVVFWRHLPCPELLMHSSPIFGRYPPGGCPNCRCSAVPVVSIDELFKSTHYRIEVYVDDAIRHLTKSQFMRILEQETYAVLN